ncbi:MAG: putative sulfate exporter family transporter [Sphingomonadales bacterium]|nr:putative sulfate exporter family transporter [Sphingomonadales bacterium]
MRHAHWNDLPSGGDLFGELHLADTRPTEEQGHRLFPGLAACAAGSAAAAWLSDHYGFPIILLGLLVGLSLNFISANEATHRGLDFASRTFLRIGIVVLGLQVTFAQIAVLGPIPFGALIVVMALTMGAGLLGARLAGQSPYAGLLAGGATAICGASAALALYGVIGRQRLSQAQFALTLVGISLASALAMTIYPLIAGEFGLNDAQAGFLIGASIHDVAQAIGGGYAFSDTAGASATIVKLARVALLAPVVALVSLILRPESGTNTRFWRRLALPWFIVAFLAVVTLNSAIAVPEAAREWALSGSKALLLLAVTATAMRTRLDLLLEMGWRATVPVALATLTSFGIALLFALTAI